MTTPERIAELTYMSHRADPTGWHCEDCGAGFDSPGRDRVAAAQAHRWVMVVEELRSPLYDEARQVIDTVYRWHPAGLPPGEPA